MGDGGPPDPPPGEQQLARHLGPVARLSPGPHRGPRRVVTTSTRWTVGAPVLIASVFLAVRYWLATTPTLSETYYDEALTGLMALAILRGVPQVFYWGEPYGGAAGDAYLAAAGFWLFGASTLVLRMAAVTVTVLWAWALWSIARRITGEPLGLLAGLLVAVPPVFLSYVQLSSQGEGVAMTLGALVLAAAARLVDFEASPRWQGAAWALLGLAGGLGWWASPIMSMCLLAAALVIVVARPRTLREPGCYVALALFALGSLPFWLWNARHEWATLWHLLTWGQTLPRWPIRIENVAGSLLHAVQGQFWDAREVRLPGPAALLGWVVVLVVYVPGVLLAAARLATWGRRLARRERPWQDPLDAVAVALWLTVAAHLGTWFGTSGVLRYSITFFVPLPVLAAVWLSRVAGWGWAGRAAAVGLAAAVLGHHALEHVLFVRQAEGQPRRPVDGVIARLDALGIRACYADSRIAQVISFESRERIVCSDYYGLRNYAHLQTVDAIEDPATVAIVTHRVLQYPHPEVMAATLRLMGAEPRRAEVGDYVVFHHIRPPDPRLRPVSPEGWTARASTGTAAAPLAFDRQVWTRWSASKAGGEWIEVDLGRAHRVVQLTLEPGPFPRDEPEGLRVETSPDGQVWDTAAEVPEIVAGLHWWRGHPRDDRPGRVTVRLQPRPVRSLRVTQIGRGETGALWSVGELFVYEEADAPWEPPASAQAAVSGARVELAHWMDDPTGPHPRRAPVTYEHRRAQVRWALVLDAANRALDVAPEWQEAHHLYAEALLLSGWGDDLDVALERARADGAWRDAMRWAELAEARSPGFWRSGRDEARIEGLTRLGRATEAAALRTELGRAEAARISAGPPAARFGDDVELIGVELPSVAHPGERVPVRYTWRALRRMRADRTAFVHVVGPGRPLNQDHVMGGAFPTSRWAPGERVQETLVLALPPDLTPGAYTVRMGVWLPQARTRLPVSATDLPRARREVLAATLTVAP